MDACKISLPNDQPLQIGVQIIDMVNDKEISISLLRYQFVNKELKIGKCRVGFVVDMLQ